MPLKQWLCPPSSASDSESRMRSTSGQLSFAVLCVLPRHLRTREPGSASHVHTRQEARTRQERDGIRGWHTVNDE